MTRRLAALLLLAAMATPAFASEAKKEDPAAERAVNIAAIGAPIVWQGRLVNYVFVTTKLKVAPGADQEALRAKEPYLRDALVRAAHRTPFVDAHDLTRVDERALTAALMREGARIGGPRAFSAAVVVSQQPRQRTGLPRTGPVAPQGRAITP